MAFRIVDDEGNGAPEGAERDRTDAATVPTLDELALAYEADERAHQQAEASE